jgi:hypothetical protein
MAMEEGCLHLRIVQGRDLTTRDSGKRIHAINAQEVPGMRISLIARYRFWRQSLLNKDSGYFLYLFGNDAGMLIQKTRPKSASISRRQRNSWENLIQ